MKIIARIAIILVAALMVVGATVALSNAGALNGLLNAGRFERAFDRPTGGAPGELASRQGERQSDRGRAGQSFDLDGGFERGRFGGSGFNMLGAGEILRNLMIVAAIVAAVVALTLAWQWLSRARQRRKAA
jgi:hypothetical protein